MRAQGILKLASAGASAHRAAEGQFVLRLVAQDPFRAGLTTWHIRWTGLVAETFWRRHGRQLQPGRAVHVELEDVHSLPGSCQREPAIGGKARAVVLLPQWDETPAWT